MRSSKEAPFVRPRAYSVENIEVSSMRPLVTDQRGPKPIIIPNEQYV